MDPKILSIDDETYGAIEGENQTVMNPLRSLYQDRIPPQKILQTVSLTIPLADGPRPWTGVGLANLRPAETMICVLADYGHRQILKHWLSHVDTIIGHNLIYDISYLRTQEDFRPILNGTHTLIDTTILNALYWEARPEKSLKDLGPVYNLFKYEEGETLRNDRRFKSNWDPELHKYNGSDSHNTLLLAAYLCSLIIDEWGHTDKLSEYSIQFFSDAIWVAIRLTEAGIPLNRPLLAELHGKLANKSKEISKELKDEGFIIGGEGSDKSKRDLVLSAFDLIDKTALPKKLGVSHILDHKLVEITKGGKVSTGDQNRSLITILLKEALSCNLLNASSSLTSSSQLEFPPSSSSSSSSTDTSPTSSGSTWTPDQILKILTRWDTFTESQKLISSYLNPLLSKRNAARKNKSPYDTILLPQPETPSTTRYLFSQEIIKNPNTTYATHSRWDNWLAYPTVYIVPGPSKDTSNDSGGQRQSRFSIKNPARQTFPREIYSLERSRWGDQGCRITSDLSQIELRVPAVTSGEPTLVDAYNNKWDIHTRTAIAIFGHDTLVTRYPSLKDQPIDKWKDLNDDYDKSERLLGKTTNFAESYWAGIRRMQATALKDMGILMPYEFFKEIVLSRKDRRPVLYAWQERLLWETTKLGYVVIPFTGHSRSFEGYDYSRRLFRSSRDEEFEDQGKDETSEVLNFPIQATAANVLHRIAARLHRILPALSHPDPPCFMYANIYDALAFDCKLTFRDELIQAIKDSVKYVEQHDYWARITDYYKHFVPLGYDMKILP